MATARTATARRTRRGGARRLAPAGRRASRAKRQRAMRTTDALVARHRRLVAALAARTARRTGLPFEDLMQEGTVALVQAAKRYRKERGAFSTYATHRVQSALKRAIGKFLPVHMSERKAIAALKRKESLPFAVPIDPDAHVDPSGGINRAEARVTLAWLARALARLPAQQAAVMRARYWRNGQVREEPLSVRRVARLLKITPGRVAQLEAAARKRLLGAAERRQRGKRR